MPTRNDVADTAHPLEVPKQLLKPHRLVAELQAAARGTEEDKGVLRLNFETVLRVRTSTQQLRRALLIMDTLIKQFEKRGFVVRIGTKYTETELVLTEGTISFRLDERTTRREPPPPAPKVAKRGRKEPEYEPWRPNYVMTGTGEFTLEFGKYRLDGCRRVWRDKAEVPLEDQLHEVMEAIPSWEAWLRAKRLENEARALSAKKEESRRLSVARAREVLRRQRASLVSSLEAWERAERIRTFIAAVERSAPGPETQVWLDWANDQVLALDPLVSGPFPGDSLKVQLDSHFSGPNSWEKIPADWWSV